MPRPRHRTRSPAGKHAGFSDVSGRRIRGFPSSSSQAPARIAGRTICRTAGFSQEGTYETQENSYRRSDDFPAGDRLCDRCRGKRLERELVGLLEPLRAEFCRLCRHPVRPGNFELHRGAASLAVGAGNRPRRRSARARSHLDRHGQRRRSIPARSPCWSISTRPPGAWIRPACGGRLLRAPRPSCLCISTAIRPT